VAPAVVAVVLWPLRWWQWCCGPCGGGSGAVAPALAGPGGGVAPALPDLTHWPA